MLACCQASLLQVVAVFVDVLVFSSSKDEGQFSCIGPHGSHISTAHHAGHSNHSSLATRSNVPDTIACWNLLLDEGTVEAHVSVEDTSLWRLAQRGCSMRGSVAYTNWFSLLHLHPRHQARSPVSPNFFYVGSSCLAYIAKLHPLVCVCLAQNGLLDASTVSHHRQPAAAQ